MQKQNTRKKTPNKYTIDIYKNDALIIDQARQTDIGKVSFADATHLIVQAYEYCLENKINFVVNTDSA